MGLQSALMAMIKARLLHHLHLLNNQLDPRGSLNKVDSYYSFLLFSFKQYVFELQMII